MDKKILLIGRNPTILTNLASALTDDDFGVKTTSLVEQASQDFDAAEFDVVAFGRGVDAATNAILRTDFLSQNPIILFVDGLAPIIPLLVKQIKVALSGRPITEKVITDFSFQQTESLHIYVSTSIDCQLTVDLYQLDAVHQTQQTTLVSEFVNGGIHTFSIDNLPDLKSTVNFLAAEVPNLDLALLPLQ